MKQSSKSLMEMSDAEVMKAFGDPSQSLRLMDIGFQIDKAAADHYDSMLANCFSYYIFHKRPIKELCVFIMENYQHNPQAVIDILGDELVKKIQNILSYD